MQSFSTTSQPNNRADLLATLAGRDGDVVLRDGSTVRVRVMRPEDEPQLFNLFKSLSTESRWLRFLSAASRRRLSPFAGP